MYIDPIKMYEKYGIQKKGVIHIGAHEGTENKFYQELIIPKVLFVEANPEVYRRLCDNMKEFSNVQSVCCAISDRIGECLLHVTSMDQSSSVLPLKHHKVVFPSIKEVKCITVKCTTLDSLVEELHLNPADFNFINIDIQGAELLAFRGAENLLKNHIQAINTEVNYEEMYESCALKTDIDKFLNQFGFKCVEVYKAHSTWGDAFYVKGTK